jgi:hypothetical protein
MRLRNSSEAFWDSDTFAVESAESGGAFLHAAKESISTRNHERMTRTVGL